MTAILAVDYYYQIILVADCRVTWATKSKNSPRVQDNLQKVYPLGPTGVVGFAGGVAAAKAVINRIRQRDPRLPLPPSARGIVDEIAGWAKEAYAKLPASDKIYVEFMYVAADYGNISMVTQNAVFAENLLVKLVSPDFVPQYNKDFVTLGLADQYPPEHIIQSRDSMLNYGLDDMGQKFQIGVAIGEFGEGLAKLCGDPVGGLFAIGTISARDGVRWSAYGLSDQVKLEIEGDTFVQYDHRDGTRIPLKPIWDFDVRRPDTGDLRLKNRPEI